MKKLSFLLIVIGSLAVFYSCRKELAPIQQQVLSTNTIGSMAVNGETKKAYVTNTESLYAAINDPENEGATIIMAPGNYVLNAAYPHGGRVELQHNMTIIGQEGHPEQVVIEATQLPSSSLVIPPTPTYPVTLRTGVLRMGNGYNALEWVTLKNDPAHVIRSLIQTDLVNTPVAKIKIDHCIISGATIGISIVNRDAVTRGRTIEASLEDNEIKGNVVAPIRAGIQIQNSQATADAKINVVLRRNYIHGNGSGLSAFNGSSSRCTIAIKSYDDRLEENGLGLNLGGGYGESTAIPTNDNSTFFEAYATDIRNNAGTPAPFSANPPGGVFATGGNIPANTGPGTVNNNKLVVSFRGSHIEDNVGDFNVKAFGAYSNNPSVSSIGSNNSAFVYLNGVSKQTSAEAIFSSPAEPGGTNTAYIIK